MIANNLNSILERIGRAAARSGRQPESVKLVAVSKTVGPQPIREAVAAGVTDLGENYVQEARDKVAALSGLAVSWHYIGHLQSNKAKYAVKIFDLIHSVDSLKLAGELNRQAQKAGKVQRILIQVNLAGETSKSGVTEADAPALARAVAGLEHVMVEGLMTMPPFFNAPERVRPYFRALQTLRDGIAAMQIPGVQMKELSMGMTGDFEVAVEEGATLVRVGTAIFGERL
jgi:pyridoxal phosphate enzyme (YggS family)